MKNHYGYDAYRGRSGVRTFLKVLVVLLAIVLAALLLGALWLTERYGVYSADGMRLELPWLAQTQTPQPEPETPAPTPLPTPSLVVVTPPPAAPEALHALVLPREALYDGSVPQALADAGANAAVFDMKSPDGTLGYVSSLELPRQAQVNAADASINAAIRFLNNTEDLYTIARISCFQDNQISNADYMLSIITNSGYRWTDPQNLRWASPGEAAIREYLTGVCLELAELGFDEILLDHAGYPTQGYLNYIRQGESYDPSRLDQVIGAFYAQVRQALEKDYPQVKLSIVTTEAALAGTDTLSGQNPENLAASAHRVWCAAPAQTETDYGDILSAAGMEDLRQGLVLLSSAPGEEDLSWAVWDR